MLNLRKVEEGYRRFSSTWVLQDAGLKKISENILDSTRKKPFHFFL
jgi:hypothetical protein